MDFGDNIEIIAFLIIKNNNFKIQMQLNIINFNQQ